MEAGKPRLARGLPQHVVVLRATREVALPRHGVRRSKLELPRSGWLVILNRCRLTKVHIEHEKIHSSSFSVCSVKFLRLAIGRFELTALMRVTMRMIEFGLTPTSVRMSIASQTLSCSLSWSLETRGVRIIPTR